MSPKGKLAEDKIQVPVVLNRDLVEKIDYYAKKARISRSQLLRNIIINGCKEIGIFDKIGFIGAVGFVRDLKEVINEIKESESEDEIPSE